VNRQPLAEYLAPFLSIEVRVGEWHSETPQPDPVITVTEDGRIQADQLACLATLEPEFPTRLPVRLSELGSVARLTNANGEQFAIGMTVPETPDSAFSIGAKVGNLIKPGQQLVIVATRALPRDLTVAFTNGLLLGADKLKRQITDEPAAATILVADAATAEALHDQIAICRGVMFARGLANTPPNVKTPNWLSEQASALAGPNLKVTVLNKRALRRLGFGGVLAVGRGSRHDPNVTILRWRGSSQAPPKAVVGKGITFDSGGLSIKPAAGMPLMKTDMAGAAAVLGTFAALGHLKPEDDIVAVIACAENMPGGSATRPGDVLEHFGGRTTEVLNTDAEGRLVLADCLAYTAEKFQPRAILDIATLTGSATVGLGRQHAACYSNNEPLAAELQSAATTSTDSIWEMPLVADYRPAIDSEIADAANTNTDPHTSAGSITAALFLEPFVGRVPWAHLDIAGTGRRESANPGCPKGATGYGVRLLTEWLTQS
jgi:leucyl aminopeptidase